MTEFTLLQLAGLLLPFAVPLAAPVVSKRAVVDAMLMLIAGFLAADQLLHAPALHPAVDILGEGSLNPNVTGVGLALIVTGAVRVAGNDGMESRRRWLQGLALIPLLLTDSVLAAAILLGALLWQITASKPRRVQGLAVGVLVLTAALVHEHLQRSMSVRVEIWRITFRVLREHWLHGIGPGGFPQAFSEARTAAYLVLKGEGTLQIDPHNLLLSVLVMFGAPIGSVLLAFMVASAMRHWQATVQVPGHRETLVQFAFQAMFNVNSALLGFIIGLICLRARLLANRPVDRLEEIG